MLVCFGVYLGGVTVPFFVETVFLTGYGTKSLALPASSVLLGISAVHVTVFWVLTLLGGWLADRVDAPRVVRAGLLGLLVLPTAGLLAVLSASSTVAALLITETLIGAPMWVVGRIAQIPRRVLPGPGPLHRNVVVRPEFHHHRRAHPVAAHLGGRPGGRGVVAGSADHHRGGGVRAARPAVVAPEPVRSGPRPVRRPRRTGLNGPDGRPSGPTGMSPTSVIRCSTRS